MVKRMYRTQSCKLRIAFSVGGNAEFRIDSAWRPTPIRNPKSRHGLTLIEVVASTMIVGLMAVAALNALGAATKSANSIGNRAVAAGLADELMSEIIDAAL